MNTTLEQEYNKKVCEEDARWDAFDKLRSEENWERYVEATKETDLALRKWFDEEPESTMLTKISEKEQMTR